MEIIRYKKLNNNIYEVELNNKVKIKLYDDVIVKYNLLLSKHIDNNKLEEIIKYNNSLEAYYTCIKYLSKKNRCEKEIRDYLEKKKYSNSIIDTTINRIINNGYLNREVYIKSYINDRYNLSIDGPIKIANNLIKLGFTSEEFSKYLDLDFTDKVSKIINKKVKSNHKLSNNMLKSNITNYLIKEGYPKELFIDLLGHIKVDNKDYLINDYNKLIKKYSNKYDGNKLKYFIKNKLYSKGYNEEEIEEIIHEELL